MICGHSNPMWKYLAQVLWASQRGSPWSSNVQDLETHLLMIWEKKTQISCSHHQPKMLIMLEKGTLLMIRTIGGLWWSHLYQIQLLVISSRRAFRRDPEQQYNKKTGEKNFKETKWFMNGGDGKPEDTGSLPLSRDRLDHDTPPPPFQPGKLLSFLRIDWSQIGNST